MIGTAKIVVSLAAVALLTAPAVAACCPAGAASSPCRMGSMHDRMGAPMRQMSEASPCHAGDRMSGECCELRPAPDRPPTRLVQIQPIFVAVELGAPPAALSPETTAPAGRSSPPRAGRLHELGRYTLYSAFLL